ncbi:MAG TPA: amidohydrolase family protein, partial [Negativicutes bacterium]|nr:amidohydrolase family protein [Negativicutes bacterium]
NIETTSPYLSLTRSYTAENSIKMEPPFRDIEDVEELWKAVSEGVVDTIGTDNVTLTKAEKRTEDTLWNTMSGYPAVETHLPVLLNEGVVKRGIPLDVLVGKLTKKPAEIFGIYPEKGTILPGSDADVVIVDLNTVREVKASDGTSRSDFSLYEGRKIKGWPVATIKNGELVAENGSYVGYCANGKYITRK